MYCELRGQKLTIMRKINKLYDRLMVNTHLPEEERGTMSNEITNKINQIIDWINNQENVPAKTLNPQSNEGLINNIVELLKNTNTNINNGFYHNAKIRINHALSLLEKLANGGTPVEDNTVGQVDLISILQRAKEENKRHNTIDVDFLLTTVMMKLSKNKPVETTKEQPLYNDLQELFEINNSNTGEILESSNKEVRIQFSGFEMYIKPDGTYRLNDTDGG